MIKQLVPHQVTPKIPYKILQLKQKKAVKPLLRRRQMQLKIAEMEKKKPRQESQVTQMILNRQLMMTKLQKDLKKL